MMNTYYFDKPVTLPYVGLVEGVTIDHVFFRASDIASNRVRVMEVKIPGINTTELGNELHLCLCCEPK